jgi:hypothetical protein
MQRDHEGGEVMRALVIIVLLARVAHADGRATAEQYFRAGAKAYAAQSFRLPPHFEEAYARSRYRNRVLDGAGVSQALPRRSERGSERAVELYRVYLEKVKKGGRVGDAADSLGEMERELSRLGATKIEALPTVERTRIGVHVSIEGQASDVVREVGDLTGNTMEGVVTKLDGNVIEPFALLDVKEGDHVVSVTAAGYFPVEKTQRAVRGATALVEVELKPQPASISIKTDGGARIAIDGRGMPSPSFELPAGKHLMTITRAGREPFGGSQVRVARAEIKAPLEKTAKRRAVPWVLGGASVLAALSITSVALAAVHDSRASDLDDEIRRGNAAPAKADEFDREIRDRDDYKTGAWVVGGAAVVAGTVGILLYAFDSPSTENVRLTATPTSAGVTATGRF